MKKTWLSWSSGKDSTWALQTLRQRDDVDLVGLFTTVNEAAQRVAMHAVRLELLKAQAQMLDLPLHIIYIPYPCTNDAYEERMQTFVDEIRNDGVQCVAFGDLFLEDVRRYREEKMKDTGIDTIFPIWGLDTKELARDMVGSLSQSLLVGFDEMQVRDGIRAKLTCVDPKQLDRRFVGREFDAALLDELPDGVDPCGENGEFHTFVYSAPVFRRALDIQVGEVVERDGFVFADITWKEES